MERWTKQFMTLWILCMMLPMGFHTVMSMEKMGESYAYRGNEGTYTMESLVHAWIVFIIVTACVGFLATIAEKQSQQNKKRGTKR